MAITLTATLVNTTSPRPVQLVLAGTTSGQAYTVTGTTADGSSWPVPGGIGVSTGAQVVLVDNRSALNVAVTYVAVVAGTTYTAAPVTVAYPAGYVLQSLDGQTIVPFRLRPDGLPRAYAPHTATFDVPGRSRPVVRVDTGGDGGGSLTVRTAKSATAALEAVQRAGGALVLRTDGTVRDLPAVSLLVISGSSTVTWDAIVNGTVSTDRVWSLTYTLIDDPQPQTALVAFTWDDFDAHMAARTWADFDSLFASSTWDAFDTTDWSQL